MGLWKTSKGFFGFVVCCLALAGAGCTETTTTNTNTATTAPNVNASPAANLNANTATDATGATIETREPEKYRATYVIAGRTTGSQSAAASLNVEVARNGTDRRYAFDTRVPGVGKIIFLDRADKRYVILEGRKQYMELTPETTGFEVPRAMTPGMLVEQLQKQRGVERVGEEQINGRTAVKYRIAGAAKTNTEAGEVKGESFVYVDKDTGLPVRAEGASASTGNVQGVSGATATMELRDIQTDVDPTLFEIPTGMNKLTGEQVQQTLKMWTTVLQAVMSNMGGVGGGGNNASPARPATGASPATTASPAVP
ncbi:MAG TPA: hypothetical protein VNA19_12510 [Pyrinomonadaceae bacterium]|jgi:hypothetical protein|nr:hypothetical protein [Pyrinomonadaceae bacterium]